MARNCRAANAGPALRERGREQARPGVSYVDLCFSAPKSASLAWAFAEIQAERNSILQVHRDTRDEALGYIEREIAKASFGHARSGGEERGNLAWITFDHFTSRPTVTVTRPDPVTGVVETELHSVRVAGDPQRVRHRRRELESAEEPGQPKPDRQHGEDFEKGAGHPHEQSSGAPCR